MTFQKGKRPWNFGKKLKNSHPQMGFKRGNKHAEHPNAVANRFTTGQHPSPDTEFKKGYVPQLDKRRSFAGSKNPAWKGEEVKISKKEYLCSKYKRWRSEVKKRDNFKCRIANESCSSRLEAHHILNWKDYPELRYELNNGITLCQAHHPRGRAEEKRLIPTFLELVSVSSDSL